MRNYAISKGRNTYNCNHNRSKQINKQPQQKGEGLMDILKGLYKAPEVYASQTAKNLIDLIPSTDDTARKGFQGEKHAILKLKNGVGVANWMGPGTSVINRLNRGPGGDPGRTTSDTACKLHDIQYALAQGSKTKDEQIKRVREADERMIKNLNRIAKDKTDSVFNIEQGRKLIGAKMSLEDRGLMKKGSFGGELRNIPENENILLNKAKADLEQQGYGKPADGLRLKLIKQHSKSKMKGKGINIDFLLKFIIPQIAKDLNINLKHIPINKIVDVVKQIKGGNTQEIIKKISPILLNLFIKGHQKTQGGGAMKSLINDISDDPWYKKLNSKLGEALFKTFRFLTKHMTGSGVNKKKLYKLRGGSFWESFKKGFRAVFKPAASVLGTLASATGLPEIGVPLTIAGKLV